MDEIVKARDEAIDTATKQRQARMFAARIGLLKDKWDSLKPKESLDCDMEVVRLKEVNAKDGMNGLVGGLH